MSVADDGSNGTFDVNAGERPGPVLKRMSNIQEPTVSGFLDEAEHAFIQMMKLYVPMQASSGATDGVDINDKTVTLDYYDVDGNLVETRYDAKPLIGAFIYGPSEGVEGVGFVGHGRRDAYGAVSLDDGVTWKETNLSESASETSCDDANCDFQRTDIPLFADISGGEAEDAYYYPGDVVNIFHAVAGNRVLVAWPSRFCASGQPSYSLDNEEKLELLDRRDAIAEYLGIDLETATPDDLYLIDMYGVGGSQGSVDYEEEDDYEPNQAVGEVPYSCLWTARGVLLTGDDPRTEDVTELSYMRWFKAERLTSGVRDVNRIETQCVAGAGCAITWQEDPDGLRGGKGEGPGEGWSGAVANGGTDIWYSYLDWEDFDVVQDPADETGATPMELADYEVAADGGTDPNNPVDVTQKPKPFVPFAMPMRLTDNAKCNTTNPKPYCNGAAISGDFPDLPLPTDYGLRDLCATLTDWTDPKGVVQELCTTDTGWPLRGNTASTRPRLGLYGYDSDGDVDPAKGAVIDNAFVVVVAEEDKGFGSFLVDPSTGNESDAPWDIGKNIWYHSFSMSLTDDLGTNAELDGLLANLVSRGNMLNQPEVKWGPADSPGAGDFYPVQDATGFGFDVYNTEIARRGSLLAQDIGKVHKDTSKADGGLIALPSWKQGIMNQGGPADVMVRRIVMDKGKWDLATNGNPYAFRYMDCEEWAYDDGLNPYYPEGVCLDSAINLSATIPDTCVLSSGGEDGEPSGEEPEDVDCPEVDLSAGTTFGIGDTDPVLRGSTVVEPNQTKVLSWHQCPAEFTTVSSSTGLTTEVNCDNDQRTDASTLADQSWYNPLDVAKGHRGFLDGDFVMMLYAWSPNWRLNAVGKDRYELYIRRSFDGAATWTTQPNQYKHWDNVQYGGDGTVTCETFRTAETQIGSDPVATGEPRICNSYDAGAAEQARNVTQHKSMRITTLDPRYAPTAGTIPLTLPAELAELGFSGAQDYQLSTDEEPEDVRDPSRYFIVYETGDNTTTEDGEPEPLDLFYSRAVMFGDHYQVWAEEDDLDACYPNDLHLEADETAPEELLVAEGSGFCNEFDQMEQGTPGLEASEASLTANPGGQFLYGTWAQIQHDEETGEPVESDAMARRVWWLDDYISDTWAWDFGQGTGDGVPAN